MEEDSRWSQGPHRLDCCWYAFCSLLFVVRGRGEERRKEERG